LYSKDIMLTFNWSATDNLNIILAVQLSNAKAGFLLRCQSGIYIHRIIMDYVLRSSSRSLWFYQQLKSNLFETQNLRRRKKYFLNLATSLKQKIKYQIKLLKEIIVFKKNLRKNTMINNHLNKILLSYITNQNFLFL
jgi:hypothetical protein